MGNINYISSIVKLLEEPKKKKLQGSAKNEMTVLTMRAHLPQTRSSSNKQSLITLVFHEDLNQDILNYYQPNDCVIVEGYVFVKNPRDRELEFRRLKSIEITVLKIYPFLF